MTQTLRIPFVLPSLNQLFGRSVGEKIRIKRDNRDAVVLLAQSQKLQPMRRVRVAFAYTEPHKKRDPDNVFGGASKIVLDALQAAGVLEDDGQDVIAGISHEIIGHDPRAPGVVVTLTEV